MSKVTRNEYDYAEFIKEYPNDDVCLQKVFEKTYGSANHCPKCESELGYVRVKNRKSYQCRKCYNQVYPLVGSVFARTKIPLTMWFYGIFMFTVSKNGLSAHELSRAIGVTVKTALRMLKKIREFIVNDESPLQNMVEADEAMVGGRQKNRHKNKRKKGTGGRSTVDKTLVFGMIERGGRVIAKILPDAKQETLRSALFKYVEQGSYLATDEFSGYNGLGDYYIHETCNHNNGQYVSGEASTNLVENFWSVLKRTIKGSYIRVKYLNDYIKEIVFRFNNRKSPNMFKELLSCLVF